VRIGVLGFISTLSILTYLDRTCISRVQDDIKGDLGFNNIEMGLVFGAFSLGYGLFEVPGGWMGDVWGPRRVLTRIVLWWSLFTALTGCIGRFSWDSGYQIGAFGWQVPLLVNSFVAMVLVRFMFGCGEAGAYPNLARVVATWFPYRERGRAQGAIWMFARLGGAMAPLVIGRLTGLFGWQPAFWVLGMAGVLWCAVFFYWFRDRPEDMPRCNEAERELIRDGLPAVEREKHHDGLPWKRVLTNPTMWALCVSGVFVNFAWYFYPTWQPRYFKDVFNLSMKDSELLTGLPYICGAVGALCGGGISDWLIRRTGSKRWGRSLVGLAGFGGAGLCFLLLLWVKEDWQAVTVLCLVFLINDLAVPVIWSAATDISGRFAGAVSGLMNMAGCIGAFFGPALTGVFLEAEPETSTAGQWPFIFGLYAAAWVISGLAWLFVDAGRPIVHDGPEPKT
jgi:MFS family permease